tara:strand:- start:891 stop:1223 length:333 start_codon:yes stop_codon:yes gene_type:complete
MINPILITAIKALPWKKILIVAGIVVLIVGVVTLIKEYGDARYKSGELSEKQAWVQAQSEFIKEIEEAEEKASNAEDVRVSRWEDHVEAEKKEVEHAKSEGESVFDIMFR